ncbi:hypothetical protein LguiB_023862 [Lonicera macranthoides]
MERKSRNGRKPMSADLVHRDSPKSPFYDPSLTPSQRIANALRRSVRWFNIFKSGSPKSPFYSHRSRRISHEDIRPLAHRELIC